MRPGPVIRIILGTALGGLISATSWAQPGGLVEGVSWEGCFAPPSNRSFACDTDLGAPFELVIWLVPFPTGEPHAVIGADARLLIESPGPDLPSWWRLEPGACRAGTAALEFASPAPSGCADAWGGLASGGIQYQLPVACDQGQIFLALHAAMPPGQSRTFEHAAYALFRLRLSRANTVGPGACGGCSSPVCLISNGVFIRGLTQPGWGYSTFGVASWQGASCRWDSPCPGPTPVRPSTWGAIKAIYR
jgi:hypothetical protein